MHILIVEDNRALGLFLQRGLKLEGHETAWVEDGDAAIEHLRANQIDLMVLDLSLPRRDGIEVLEELRALSLETAVLVLTGRNNLEERIRCFNLGADDCLLKPFSFHELTARCRAILRRSSGGQENVLRFGEFEMDLVSRGVKCHQHDVELTPKEFSLLEFLVRRKGACCSRDEVVEHVWKSKAESTTNVVEVCVTSLRKKLATVEQYKPCRASLIETVRGRGYRVLGELSKSSQAINTCSPPLLARGA